MNFSHLLLAAGLFSFSAAAAQTTPGTAVPSVPGAAGTASPNSVPSGMASPTADPKGAVSPSEVFTKGAPDGDMSNKRMTKRKKMKGSMSGDKDMTKPKM